MQNRITLVPPAQGLVSPIDLDTSLKPHLRQDGKLQPAGKAILYDTWGELKGVLPGLDKASVAAYREIYSKYNSPINFDKALKAQQAAPEVMTEPAAPAEPDAQVSPAPAPNEEQVSAFGAKESLLHRPFRILRRGVGPRGKTLAAIGRHYQDFDWKIDQVTSVPGATQCKTTRFTAEVSLIPALVDPKSKLLSTATDERASRTQARKVEIAISETDQNKLYIEIDRVFLWEGEKRGYVLTALQGFTQPQAQLLNRIWRYLQQRAADGSLQTTAKGQEGLSRFYKEAAQVNAARTILKEVSENSGGIYCEKTAQGVSYHFSPAISPAAGVRQQLWLPPSGALDVVLFADGNHFRVEVGGKEIGRHYSLKSRALDAEYGKMLRALFKMAEKSAVEPVITRHKEPETHGAGSYLVKHQTFALEAQKNFQPLAESEAQRLYDCAQRMERALAGVSRPHVPLPKFPASPAEIAAAVADYQAGLHNELRTFDFSNALPADQRAAKMLNEKITTGGQFLQHAAYGHDTQGKTACGENWYAMLNAADDLCVALETVFPRLVAKAQAQ